MMRYTNTSITTTPTSTNNNSNNNSNSNSYNNNISNNYIASRKRRSESAPMFPSSSQNENRMNHPERIDSTTSNHASSSGAASATAITTPTTTDTNGLMTTTTTIKVQLKVRIKGYHSVAHWTWGSNTKDDVCSICQNAFEGVCPGVKYPGEDCPVVWGKCLHAFHLQCINTWLTSSVLSTANTNSANPKSSCPICRQEWEFSSSNAASSTTSTATGTAITSEVPVAMS